MKLRSFQSFLMTAAFNFLVSLLNC